MRNATEVAADYTTREFGSKRVSRNEKKFDKPRAARGLGGLAAFV